MGIKCHVSTIKLQSCKTRRPTMDALHCLILVLANKRSHDFCWMNRGGCAKVYFPQKTKYTQPICELQSMVRRAPIATTSEQSMEMGARRNAAKESERIRQGPHYGTLLKRKK